MNRSQQHPHGEVRAEGEPRTTRAPVMLFQSRASDPSRLAFDKLRLAPQDEGCRLQCA
jgi:hypothetical protein